MKIAVNDTCKDECREHFKQAFSFVDGAFEENASDEEEQISVIEELNDDFSDEQKVIRTFNKVFKEIVRGKNNNRVLVHCSLGVSRSATFAIMYVMKKFRTPFEEVES